MHRVHLEEAFRLEFFRVLKYLGIKVSPYEINIHKSPLLNLDLANHDILSSHSLQIEKHRRKYSQRLLENSQNIVHLLNSVNTHIATITIELVNFLFDFSQNIRILSQKIDGNLSGTGSGIGSSYEKAYHIITDSL